MSKYTINPELCSFVKDKHNQNVEWIYEDGRDTSRIRVDGKYYEVSDKHATEGDKIFIRRLNTGCEPYAYGDIFTVECVYNALDAVLVTEEGYAVLYPEYYTLIPLDVVDDEEDIIRVLARIVVLMNEQNDRISVLESDIEDLRTNLTADNYEKTRRLSEIERSLDNLKVVRSDSRTDLD